MRYEPPSGGTVYTACKEAIEFAKANQCLIQFVVNGIDMNVYPTYNAEQAAEIVQLRLQMTRISERLTQLGI